ncbi:MAG: leucine-rich repeat domain-containing protein, partial [Clostridia bacterium]|nr:leucine-rich repeat domain-containing protein [Clostridia bacterium]
EVTKYLLKSMSADELLSKVTRIADWTFDCMKMPKTVVIPKNISEMGYGCFSCCKGVEKVTFESGCNVEKIDCWTFEICEDLKVVDLGNCLQLKEICEDAFIHCTSLTDVVLPPNLERIAGFGDCFSLTKFVVPSKVKVIGGGAFWNSESMTSVTIPASVKVIGHSAFAGCTSLKDVYYDGTKEQWEKIKIYDCNDSLLSAELHFAE